LNFNFLHESSTVLELVISGVFENLRILLQVLLAVELETKVLEHKKTRFCTLHQGKPPEG
jgi:hypothetical protein